VSDLRERYASISDEELAFLAGQGRSEFGDVAWVLLQEEVARRGLPQSLPREPDAPNADVAEAHVCQPTFTGRGGEYFRIWAVNLLLTLATLGVYSAWAKVRKVRYFRNNTRLEGHSFDYHGSPVAILRGRLLALVLFAAYSWAFAFSKVAGLVTLVALCATGPWLIMRAQQFALGNTSFRGLRFGFRAQPRQAYVTLLPVLVLWLSPTAASVFMTDLWWLGWTALGIPWMHHRLKAFQRRYASYGDREFTFTPAALRFYWIYAKGIGFAMLGGLLGGTVLVAIFGARNTYDPISGVSSIDSLIYGGIALLFMYVMAWPYYAARLQQVVWSRTQLGDVRFGTKIRAWALFRLVLRNATLTVLSAGLYWPWAAIALARYRIECIRIESPVPLAALAGGIQAPPVSALGEGATDAFGVDIGL
jgi:uncharacterized membrane protein YjgN (DUF898 family)